jgi:hypothetical protein
LSVLCRSTRLLARALSTIPAAALLSPVIVHAAAARAAPSIRTDRACYLVGQRVRVTGTGFTAGRTFDVAIDGVDFGQSRTDATGAFSSSLVPGGLAAGVVQHVDHLDATDGTRGARTSFTLTRTAGARFLATSGNPNTLMAPFEVWGFALDGHRKRVFLHWVAPSGRVRETAALGRTRGQCGYLRTHRRRVFPFAPSLGSWTLQLDTRRRYVRHPSGPVARIRVRVS